MIYFPLFLIGKIDWRRPGRDWIELFYLSASCSFSSVFLKLSTLLNSWLKSSDLFLLVMDFVKQSFASVRLSRYRLATPQLCSSCPCILYLEASCRSSRSISSMPCLLKRITVISMLLHLYVSLSASSRFILSSI